MSILQQIDHIILKYIPMHIHLSLLVFFKHIGFNPPWVIRLVLLSPVYRFAVKQKYNKHEKNFFKTHIRKLADYCSNISTYQEFLAYVYGIVVYSNIPPYKIVDGIGKEYEPGLFETTNKSSIQKHIDDIHYLYTTSITKNTHKLFEDNSVQCQMLLVLFYIDAIFSMEEDLHNYLQGSEESVINDLQKLYFSWLKLGIISGWVKENE